MDKAVLISIKPEWVAKILNGEKTIEVRKTAPKCGLPIEVYIYCTKDPKWKTLINRGGFLTGMVVAKFTLREVEKITKRKIWGELEVYGEHTDFIELDRKTCLKQYEIADYMGCNYHAYAWHISDLEIFDEPKELSEFYTLKCSQKKWPCNIKDVFGLEECHRICKLCKPLTKPPRSWQFTEIEEK